MIQEFFAGFTTPIRALKLISFEPKLLALSIMPVLITLGMIAVIIYGTLAGTSSLIYSHMNAYFGGFAQGLIFIALLFLAFQASILLTSLFAIPFNDFLAEATERACGEEPPSRKGFGYYARVMLMDIAKTILNLVMTIIFTLGTWIPAAGIVFFLGLAILNTLNFVSYPQSRRLQGVGASFVFIKQNGPRSLGFGIATLILFTVPVVNFFALPLSVVGGTLVFLRR